MYQALRDSLQFSEHLVDPLKQSLVVALEALEAFAKHFKIALGIRPPFCQVVPLVIPFPIPTTHVEVERRNPNQKSHDHAPLSDVGSYYESRFHGLYCTQSRWPSRKPSWYISEASTFSPSLRFCISARIACA